MGKSPKISNANEPQRVRQLRVQSSTQGVVLPLLYGLTRLAGNIIWADNFKAIRQSQSSGGKGGGRVVQVEYTYTVSCMLGLCEGPATTIHQATLGTSPGSAVNQNTPVNPSVWRLKRVVAATKDMPKPHAGFERFGTLPLVQGTVPATIAGDADAVWDHLSTLFPDEALTYAGVAYVAAKDMNLDSNASLPNFNFPVIGLKPYWVTYGNLRFDPDSGFTGTTTIRDANPADIIQDLLTNTKHGLGWPAGQVGDLFTGPNSFSSYCRANHIWLSPLYDNQRSAAQALKDLAAICNSELVWSEGRLRVVPYGDEVVSSDATLVVYNPFLETNREGAFITPRYHLTDDDFLATGPKDDPVLVNRKAVTDRHTKVSVEYLNRANAYSPDVAEATDAAGITTQGGAVRAKQPEQMHAIHSSRLAREVAQRMLQRQIAVPNEYEFQLGPRYVLLDPMDVVTITETVCGLVQYPVRILSVTETETGAFDVVAEDLPVGVHSVDSYPSQGGQRGGVDFNIAPGPTTSPVLFEPLYPLVASPELWVAASGDPDTWGGVAVFLAEEEDGDYTLADTIQGPCRHGRLVTALPAVASPDQTSAPQVALWDEQSLVAGTVADAAALRRLLYIGHGDTYELVSFSQATFLGTLWDGWRPLQRRYQLGTYLVRGAYATAPRSHTANTPVVVLDDQLARVPLPERLIGKQVFLKLVPFNVYGNAAAGIEDVTAISHTVTGVFLLSPLPDVTGTHATSLDGYTQLGWATVEDPRAPLQYEVRVGATWAGGAILGRTPLTSMVVRGAGTYWISAVVEVETGLGRRTVYSETPASVVVTAPTLTTDFRRELELAGLGWPGSANPYAVAVMERDPFLYLRFTDPARPVLDFSGTMPPDSLAVVGLSAHATVVGGLEVQSAPPENRGLRCNGNGYAFSFGWSEFGQLRGHLPVISYCFLLKRGRTNVVGGEVVLDGSQDQVGDTYWRFGIAQDGNVFFDKGRSDTTWGVSTGAPLNNLTAHHVCISILGSPEDYPLPVNGLAADRLTAGVLVCQIDGVEVLAAFATDFTPVQPMTIGGRYATGGGARTHFLGDLDEFSAHPLDLTQGGAVPLHAAWSAGTLRLDVDRTQGVIRLANRSTFDAIPVVDDAPTISGLGGYQAEGVFYVDHSRAPLALSAVTRVRPSLELDALAINPTDVFNAIPVVDEDAWIDDADPTLIEGFGEYSPATLVPRLAKTPLSPLYAQAALNDAFRRYQPGVIDTQRTRWRFTLRQRDPLALGEIRRALIGVDALPRSERGEGVPVGAGVAAILGVGGATGFAPTVSIRTLLPAASGDTVVLLIACVDPDDLVVTDSAGGTYTIVGFATASGPTGVSLRVAYRTLGSTLVADSTIIVASPLTNWLAVSAVSLVGVSTVDKVAGSTSDQASSGNPAAVSTAASGTLAQANEVLVAAIAARAAASAVNYVPQQGMELPTAGITSVQGGGGPSLDVSVMGQVLGVASTASVALSGTITVPTGTRWASVLVTFRATPGAFRITFARPFNVVPSVQVTIENAQADDDVEITNITPGGFDVRVKNGGAAQSRVIDWIATGD